MGITHLYTRWARSTVPSLVPVRFAVRPPRSPSRTRRSSPRVAQIAALTERIRYMAAHLSTHHKDNASRRGLIAMLERRKKLLKYLRRRDGDSYGEVIYRLGLKDRSFVEDKYPKTSARK